MRKILANPLPFITLVAVATLAAAYGSQYLFNWAPCALCLKQRIPYWAAIAIGIIGMAVKKFKPAAIALIALCFMATLGLASYHVGVEKGIFSSGCTAEAGDTGSIEAMKAAIMNAPLVSCDQPTAVILGFSLAEWHVVYSAVLVIFTLVMVRQNVRSKKNQPAR